MSVSSIVSTTIQGSRAVSRLLLHYFYYICTRYAHLELDITTKMATNHDIQMTYDDIDEIDLHEECSRNPFRSFIIMQYIERYPESLAKEDKDRQLPLHIVLMNDSSAVDLALIMMEKYPAALQHRDIDLDLPVHLECENQSRSIIIAKCIDLYPEALAKSNKEGDLPLHSLLKNMTSTVQDALMMIKKLPDSVKHQNNYGYLPLHIECSRQGRLSSMLKLIELYPESLAMTDRSECFPLHVLLRNKSSTVDVALMIIEKYPAALKHQKICSHYLPIHVECDNQCRPYVISKCIELYPESLAIAGLGYLPLHLLLRKISITVDIALLMIVKYPTALKH
jgi:hypothetical protein